MIKHEDVIGGSSAVISDDTTITPGSVVYDRWGTNLVVTSIDTSASGRRLNGDPTIKVRRAQFPTEAPMLADSASLRSSSWQTSYGASSSPLSTGAKVAIGIGSASLVGLIIALLRRR